MNERDAEKFELFNSWNQKQQELDAKKRKLLFKEGEIWWCSIGINVGVEVYGKGEDFRRPVVILKKLSHNSCVVLPVTTQKHIGDWFYYINTDKRDRWVLINQIRHISTNRLLGRQSQLLTGEFLKLKKSVANLLGFFQILPVSEHGVVGESQKAYPNEYFESIASPLGDANNLILLIREESGRMEVMATKTTPEFEEAYARLNAEQKAAVDAINGPVFVVAGPGTGKTQVLALRIANILKLTDTTPESILALTFTEVGAREMRARLARVIGATTAWKIRIHTFHGFAQSLVSRFPEQFPRIVGAEIATDAERAEILEAAILQAQVKILRPYGDPLFYHYAIGQAISTMKRENVTLEALAERVREADAEFDAIPGKIHEKGKYIGKMKGEFETLQKKITRTHELMSVYELYQKGLEEKKRYDFEDVILEVVRAFGEGADESENQNQNNAAFKREVQESLLYVLADEHQDANRAQNALLEHLTDYDDHPNLFIVGDEKQAIYRFQGADLDNVHYFRERFTGTKVIVLTQNYRSTQTILDSALSLVSASPDERLSRLPLASNSKLKSRPITVAHAPTSEAEADYLAEEIMKLLNTEISGDFVAAEDIAILVRKNKDVAWLSDALMKRGVPIAASGEERNALADPYVQALWRLLAAVNEQRDERLVDVLTLPGFKLSAADIWRITQRARSARIPAIDVLRKEEELTAAGVGDVATARKVFNTLQTLSEKASIERPAEVAEEAFRVSGLLDAMLHSSGRDRSFTAIRAFFDLLEEMSSRENGALLPRALTLLTLYEERGISLKGQGDESLMTGRVRIMTAHRSKGREFRFVFVPRLTESSWSTRNRAEYFYLPDILSGAAELEDERRLLYVAMTRAKEHLTLSYATARDDGKEIAPSALTEDIDPKLIESIEVEEKESSDQFAFLPSTGLHKPGKEASDDDRTTLRNAFLAQGLSPTALNNYLKCPSEYFYVNLLRLPKPENKHMLYGTAIHAALKSYADRRARGDDVPGDYLVTEFKRVLSKSPLNPRDFEEAEAKGRRALMLWWRENQVSWPNKVEAEVPAEAPFTLKDGTTFTIRGKLDRIDPLSGDTVSVIDYKTGSPKSRNELMGKTASSDGNYFRQLVFYKLLLAGADIPREMTEGVIEFVEPDDKDVMHKEVFAISETDVIELKETIERVSQEIMSLSFWDAHCADPACEWCGLRFDY